MKEYVLLFRHENVNGKVSPEQMQQWMKQQMDWINTIVAKNQFVSGTGLLFDDAKVVSISFCWQSYTNILTLTKQTSI
jgi:hypothetical protein